MKVFAGIFFLMVLIASGQMTGGPQPGAVQESRPTRSLQPTSPDSQQARIARTRTIREELEAILNADSVYWIKATAQRNPEISREDMERERRERRQRSIEALCRQGRFSSSVEVDSLPRLTPSEKTACKILVTPVRDLDARYGTQGAP